MPKSTTTAQHNPPLNTQMAKPLTRPASSQVSAPAPTIRPAPSPAAAAPHFSATPTPATTTPAPITTAPTPAAPLARPRQQGGNGWLRDVLRNASASQQQATSATKPAGNPITTLTSEIAQAIDEQALNEAWQRYQAGETGVFSRRIYTLTGQGTYDEVRKKLQRDPEFAQTTRDYVAEFEQLLQTAKNTEEARNILTSDRGKVFTMLAHASGRIS